MKKQMISFTIPQYDKLKNESFRLGISVSELVRRYIDGHCHPQRFISLKEFLEAISSAIKGDAKLKQGVFSGFVAVQPCEANIANKLINLLPTKKDVVTNEMHKLRMKCAKTEKHSNNCPWIPIVGTHSPIQCPWNNTERLIDGIRRLGEITNSAAK